MNGKAFATLNKLDEMHDRNEWAAPSLGRTWSLMTGMTPNLKRLKAHAEKSLRVLEAAGMTQFESQIHVWEAPSQNVREAARTLGALGVELGISSPSKGSNVILVVLAQGGGSWDGSADSVVEWIDAFVAAPRCADNLKKLYVPGAQERHLAVFAHMSAVPWAVWRSLIDHYETGVVPTTPPTLPEPLTHLWLLPAPGGPTGLAYDSVRSWFRFDATDPQGG